MHFVISAACAHYFGDFTFVMPEVIAKELAERAQESSMEEDAHLPDRTRKAYRRLARKSSLSGLLRPTTA